MVPAPMTLIRFVMMNSLLECGLQSIRQDGGSIGLPTRRPKAKPPHHLGR
jgi:hypothetical protein